MAQSLTEPLTCDGETIVVNRHGALISSSVHLRVGMMIEIHVIMTDKSAPDRRTFGEHLFHRTTGTKVAINREIYGCWSLVHPHFGNADPFSETWVQSWVLLRGHS